MLCKDKDTSEYETTLNEPRIFIKICIFENAIEKKSTENRVACTKYSMKALNFGYFVHFFILFVFCAILSTLKFSTSAWKPTELIIIEERLKISNQLYFYIFILSTCFSNYRHHHYYVSTNVFL